MAKHLINPLSESEMESLFAEMTEGRSIASILQERGKLKDYGKVLMMLKAVPELADRYESVKKARAFAYRDKFIRAMEGKDDWGEEEDPARSRLKMEGYKWLMSVDDRESYGEQKQININGQIDIVGAMARAEERVLNGVVDDED